MRIERFSRIRDYGVFRDFAWPHNLPAFARFNLIYGWNGTGKTTLSRILRDIELRRTPARGDVRVRIDGSDIGGSDFAQIGLQIRVFNRDFITENVFRVDGGELAPIYVLGAESVDKQKEVERLKGELAKTQSEVDTARSTKQKAERDLDQFCIDRAKVIKDTLRSSGQNPYNNYDKSDFRCDVEKMCEAGDGSAHRLSEAERDKLLTQHRATPRPKVQEVECALPDLDLTRMKVSAILGTTVVSEAIEALKGDRTLAEWTRRGLELHRDRKAERCLFCEQALPKNRLAALEAHFNAQYEQFMHGLDRLIGEIAASSKRAAELQLPNKAELYGDLVEEYQTAEAGLKQALNAARAFLDDAVKTLQEKKTRAFEEMPLGIELPPVDAQAIEKLNAVIRKHNRACDDFETRVTEARRRLAQDMIAEVLQDFKSRRAALKRAEEELQTAQKGVEHLNTEIGRLEREIVEHRRPAEELNEDLRKYLGHDELRLEVKDTGYMITRGGVPAETLSEGEMTAIALLYFLKSLQDRRFDLAKGVVVLDDPVSSLDANALYLAFGFIRERTKDAGQLFILTHNFAFFRQVRNWFHYLKGQKKRDPSQRPARFYMLDCVPDGGGRSASLQWLDPLLEQYDSEYHYLFARIHRAAIGAGTGSLEEKYVLPNMARRLLEAFLSFRQPQFSGDLWQKVQAIKFDEAKKLRILRFVHTYSHTSGMAEPEHDPSLLSESQAVLKDLLELIESQDGEHYKAMVHLVSARADSEPDVDEGDTA